MAVNEQIQTGRKFRKLLDKDSRLWLRISFWTKACDVEFDDHETAETKLAKMDGRINDITASFRDSINKIYNKLKGLGFTPSANSPDGICNAIQTIHDDRYANGYNSGRLQGQEDVKANPDEYGVNTGIAPENFIMRWQDVHWNDYEENLPCTPNTTATFYYDAGVVFENSVANNHFSIYIDVLVNGEWITHQRIEYAEGWDNGWDVDSEKKGPKVKKGSLSIVTGEAGYIRARFDHQNGRAFWIWGVC